MPKIMPTRNRKQVVRETINIFIKADSSVMINIKSSKLEQFDKRLVLEVKGTIYAVIRAALIKSRTFLYY